MERLKERLGSKETGWRERERRSEGRLYEMRRDGRSLEMYLFNSPQFTTAYMMSADLWMSPTVKAEILKTFLQQNEAQNDVIRAF